MARRKISAAPFLLEPGLGRGRSDGNIRRTPRINLVAGSGYEAITHDDLDVVGRASAP
jgi:hypothetical protein